MNNIEREILPPGFYMTRINQLEPERNYVIQVESIVNAGTVDQSTQGTDFRLPFFMFRQDMCDRVKGVTVGFGPCFH